jgi:MerR family transcriptional regulator/heat shock protein HspR
MTAPDERRPAAGSSSPPPGAGRHRAADEAVAAHSVAEPPAAQPVSPREPTAAGPQREGAADAPRGIPHPPDAPVFVISVAAELAGMHAQTLRSYDREGLVSPGRTAGGGRRYSQRDIELLQQVQRLSQAEGVNRAGIRRIIELEAETDALRARLEELVAEVSELRHELQMSRMDAANAVANTLAGLRRDLVPWRSTGTAIVTWRPSGRR